MTFEDFFYKKLLKPLLYKSTLGKNSIDGNADTGFNFEYMYQNKPSGDGFLGKSIDRILLNLPAVQATRNRKESIKKILKKEMESRAGTDGALQILDIASGPARYLVELGSELTQGFKAVCLDIDNRSLEYGRKLAAEYNVQHLIEYRQADIFKNDHLEKTCFTPDFMIASGLYVYHDDDATVRSLETLSTLLPKGSKALIDNQINNPSRKLMEKLGTTTRGTAWKLFYRTEQEMKQLLSPFFSSIEFTVDRWGMYCIAVATK